LEGISDRHLLISQSVDVYYAHDDRYGPFNRLVFRKPIDTGVPVSVHSGGLHHSVNQRHKLESIIVPVPPTVRCGPFHPLAAVLPHFEKAYLAAFEAIKGPDLVVLWQAFLLEGAEWKSSLEPRGYAGEFRKHYAELHLPKYVWVYEFAAIRKSEISSFLDADDRRMDGEYLYDPTTPFYEVRELSRRIRGTLFDYTSLEPRIKLPPERDDVSYKGFQTRIPATSIREQKMDDDRKGKPHTAATVSNPAATSPTAQPAISKLIAQEYRPKWEFVLPALAFAGLSYATLFRNRPTDPQYTLEFKDILNFQGGLAGVFLVLSIVCIVVAMPRFRLGKG
jgi:hypothetical protein